MDEKRRTVRLSIEIPVKIRQNGTLTNGQSRNLSCGGIFIQAPQEVKSEKPCDVILHLPDGSPPLVLKSDVVWQEPNLDEQAEEAPADDTTNVGFRFQSLAPEEKTRIQEYIKRNIREDLH